MTTGKKWEDYTPEEQAEMKAKAERSMERNRQIHDAYRAGDKEKLAELGVKHIKASITPSFASETFPWRAQGIEDYICKVGDYMMRLESMNTNIWWWRVYYKGQAIEEPTFQHSKSKYRAIGLCEGLAMGHSIALNNGVFTHNRH